MEDLGTVEDVEQVKQLEARCFRLLDTKARDAFRELFTPDVTVHHGHTPEIELTSATTATGVWAMEDHRRFPDGSGTAEMHGYGHDHDTDVEPDGRWLIATQRLTRLRVDAG